jgi:hypothetical protein
MNSITQNEKLIMAGLEEMGVKVKDIKEHMPLGLEYGSKTQSEIDEALQIFMLNAFFCVVFNLI